MIGFCEIEKKNGNFFAPPPQQKVGPGAPIPTNCVSSVL